MMATTPMGTESLRMVRPLGRSTVRRTLPTGSGRAATWRTPSAMAATRSSVSASRSSITSLMLPLAAAMSSPLAARMAARPPQRLSAIASRAAFFVSVPAHRSAGRAACAASRISRVVMSAPS